MNWEQQRLELLHTMKRLDKLGMVSGSSGNASVKLPRLANTASNPEQLYLATPAGIPYDKLEAADMVVVNYDLETITGESDGT